MAYLYDHANYAFYSISTGQPAQASMAWLGQHLRKIVCSYGFGAPATTDASTHLPIPDVSRPVDFSLALAENPTLEIYPYIHTSNSRFTSAIPNLQYYSTAGWQDFKRWLADNPSYSEDNAFWHYRYDKAHTTASKSSYILVPGYPIGITPGYDQGIASAAWHSWMPSQQFGEIQSISRTISSASRNSGIVTVATSGDHGFSTYERVTIAGTSDAVLHGTFDIYSVPTTNTFTYQQAGDSASATGGTASQSYFNYYYKNVLNDEWKQYYIDSFTDTRGASYEWMKDQGGNCVTGPYCDSILNMVILQGTKIGDTDQIQWQYCDEYLGEGGTTTDSRDTKAAWLYATIGNWWKDIKTGISPYSTGKGKTIKTACNGDGLHYVSYHKAFYQQDYVDVILLESQNWPSQGPEGPTLITGYYRDVWDLMETYNKEVVNEGQTYSTYVASNYHGTTITWSNYSGNIWYTDNFAGQKTQIVKYSDGTGRQCRYQGATSIAGIGYSGGYGGLWTDTSTGRLYAYFASSPTPATGPNIQGLDPARFHVLACHMIFTHHDNGFFAYHDFYDSRYTYNMEPGDKYSWFDAMGWVGTSLGDPDTGGLKYDGSSAVDIWGNSTATSSKAYEFWRDPTITNDRIYARKFDNGYALCRWCCRAGSLTPTNRAGVDYRTIPTSFDFRPLYADGTLGPSMRSFDLALGEGIFLVTQDLEQPETPVGQRVLIGIMR